MGLLLKVAGWADHFENNRTRELKKMDWVPVPTKQDGDGYTELVGHKNGAAHLGCWLALVQVAAKCDVRGTLMREGGKPHDTTSLARISRLPAGIFAEAIPRLLAIGWLESEVIEESALATNPAGIPHECAANTAAAPQVGAATSQVARARDTTVQDSTEHGREENNTQAAPSVASQVAAVLVHYQTYHHKAKFDEKLRNKVAARLKDGFTEDELKTAIDGCHVSPWHCGDNDRGRKYQSLELIVRDSDHVNQFIELAHQKQTGAQLSAKSQRTLGSLNRMLAREENGVEH